MPPVPLTSILALFLFTFARIVPLTIIAPFLGARNSPPPVRIMFALALSALFFPKNLLASKLQVVSGTVFTGLFLKELLIGFVLGYFVTLPFWIAQSAGAIIDHQRGSSSLQVSDPTTSSQTSPLGILFNYVTLVLFFLLDGPFYFFDGIASSYELIPVDQFVSPIFFQFNTPFWQQVIQLFQHVMAMAIQLAAPSLIAIFLTDLFLGIANRLAPQVQIVFLGMSLKSWVAIAVLAAGWTVIANVMGKEAVGWVKVISNLLQKTKFS